MTREEIGSYLGLKLETVSRAFSKLQEDGMSRFGNATSASSTPRRSAALRIP